MFSIVFLVACTEETIAASDEKNVDIPAVRASWLSRKEKARRLHLITRSENVSRVGIGDVTLPGVMSVNSGGGIRKPRRDSGDRLIFWSWQDGAVQFALCDGSVKIFSFSTDQRTQAALCTRGGGEIVAGEF